MENKYCKFEWCYRFNYVKVKVIGMDGFDFPRGRPTDLDSRRPRLLLVLLQCAPFVLHVSPNKPIHLL